MVLARKLHENAYPFDLNKAGRIHRVSQICGFYAY
jgi:hypothetical protein